MNKDKDKIVEADEIKQMFIFITEKLKAIEEKMEENATEMAMLRKEKEEMKRTINMQEERICSLEIELKKRNIVIQGIKDNKEEKQGEIKEKFKKVMVKMDVDINLETEIEEINRIGLYKEGRNRPIIIRLKEYNKKLEIYSQTKKLKGTEIWINNDYTNKTQKERKELIPYLKEARQKGAKAFLKHNKLIINGTEYGIEHFLNKKINQNQDKKRAMNDRSPQSEDEKNQIKRPTRTDSKNY